MKRLLLLTLILLTGSCDQVNTRRMTLEPERFFEGRELALARAVQANQLDEVRRLAKDVELNQFHKENMTPLIWAMLIDREKSFRELLRLGANPNLKDGQNVQPVAIAAGSSDNNKYMKILLENGGDPNSWQKDKPAIHNAFDREYYKNVAMLIAAKADINIRDKQDDTILISAGYQERFDKAIEFIQAGADVHVTSDGGGIALEVQESTPNVGSKTYEDQARLKKILMDKGIRFPVPHPSAKNYEPIRARWYQTPEGRQWQARLEAVGADPMGFGQKWKEVREAEITALKSWMKTNNIPEPAKPEWKPLSKE